MRAFQSKNIPNLIIKRLLRLGVDAVEIYSEINEEVINKYSKLL